MIGQNNRAVFAALFVLCLSLITAIDASATDGNGRIAFTSDRDGNLEIYSMNADGSDQRRLTNNSGVDDHATWSPDGRRLAYVREAPIGTFAICVINADGSGTVELTHVNYAPGVSWHDKWSLAWSPDGGRIAFQDNNNLWVVNADGTNRTNITPPGGDGLEPSWSPDGSRIIFTSSRVFYFTLHTMNPDGTDLQAWPSAYPPDWDMTPSWSPPGERVVFIRHGEDLLPRIVTANADGSGQVELDGGFGADHRNKPRFSPDGSRIIFHMWNFFSNDAEIYTIRASGGTQTQMTNTPGRNFNPSWQLLRKAAIADFDGDGRPDISVFRPSNSTWYLQQSTAGFMATNWGLGTDRIVPADYDGDGKTDLAVYRPSEGTWYALLSSNGTLFALNFGISEDLPSPGDFDSDGRADVTVFRPSTGTWWISRSTGGIISAEFGTSEDKPVVGDYNGDGQADLAVFRPSNGAWYYSSDLVDPSHNFVSVPFGLSTDLVTPADFDGDAKTDIAVYRPSTGIWYWLNSTNGSLGAVQFGTSDDIPTAADFDGDGRADVSVFRPSNGVWYRLNSGNGSFFSMQFGVNGDRPTPAAFRY